MTEQVLIPLKKLSPSTFPDQDSGILKIPSVPTPSSSESDFPVHSETVASKQIVDTKPPSPDPMAFEIPPYLINDTSVSMKLTAATDKSGVEYQFIRLDAKNYILSNWQDSPEFTDTDLHPNTEYDYTVRARDKSSNYNTTKSSKPLTIVTPPESPSQDFLDITETIVTPPESPSQDFLDIADTEDLFAKVFGYRREVPDKLLIPFYIGERRFGKIEIFHNKRKEEIHVWTDTILKQISPFLDPLFLKQLESETAGISTISISYLKEKGFEVVYNEDSLVFRLYIPAKYHRIKTTDIWESRIPRNIEYAISPGNFSSFVNIRAGQTFEHNVSESDGRDDRYTNVNFDTAVNFKKIVAEGVGEYSENNGWRRDKVRLVYAQPDRMLRYYLGDLSVPVRGFQVSPLMGGVGISKDFNLQPYTVTNPVSSSEIYISRPSEIDVFVNDVIVEQLSVEPGIFNFRRISFNHGVNNIKIRIRNDIGDEEIIDIDSFYNNIQLKKGLNQYSFNFGFKSERGESTYHYDTDTFISSLFYRHGIHNNLTSGFYLQTTPSQYMYGFENNLSSVFGNINANIAFSNTDSVSADYATQIFYHYSNNSPSENPFHRQWRASIEYAGRHFAPISEPEPDNDVSYLVTGSVNQEVSDMTGIFLSLAYGWARPDSGSDDAHTASFSLIKRFSRNTRVTFTINNERQSHQNEDEWKGSVNVIVNLAPGSQISSSYRTSRNTAYMNWQYKSDRYDIENMLSAYYSDDNDLTLTERLGYKGFRGNASIVHNYQQTRNEDSQNLTNIAVNTALVFAEGSFGWTPIVDNSFVLVKPNDVLKGQTIGINRRGKESFQGMSDIFGPAAVTTLSPYHVHDIRIELPELPVGYEINAFDYTLLPSYKSGFLIELVGEAFILVRGRLVYRQNKPLAYVVGEAVPIGMTSMEPQSFFTNKGGYFYIYRMKAGDFELNFKPGNWDTIPIEVSDDNETGICELGTLIVTP